MSAPRHGSGDSHATDAAYIRRELAQDNYDFMHRYDDAPGTPPPTPSYADQQRAWQRRRQHQEPPCECRCSGDTRDPRGCPAHDLH